MNIKNILSRGNHSHYCYILNIPGITIKIVYSGVRYNHGDDINVAEVAPMSNRHFDVDPRNFHQKSQNPISLHHDYTEHQSNCVYTISQTINSF